MSQHQGPVSSIPLSEEYSLWVTDPRGFQRGGWPSLQPHEYFRRGDNALAKDASATVSLQGSGLPSFRRAVLVSPWKFIRVLQVPQGERAQEAERKDSSLYTGLLGISPKEGRTVFHGKRGPPWTALHYLDGFQYHQLLRRSITYPAWLFPIKIQTAPL